MAKPALIPVDGIEFTPGQVHRVEMAAISAVLADKGESRNVAKLWWSTKMMSYVVLIDTLDDEPSVLYEVSLSKIVEKQNL